MTAIWVSQASAAPSPADLAAYLRQQGWHLTNSSENWNLFAKAVNEQTVVLEVPQRASGPSYPRLLRTLIEDLARLEQRPPAVVLRDVRASGLDIIRIGIESSATRDGRIPLEAGHHVYDATRDLVLAAACSALDARSAFSKRKPDEAMRFLSSARLGQTEFGSFVITIECSVPPLLQSQLPLMPEASSEPFERRTTMMLARGLAATETAARLAAVDGSLQPFRDRAVDGVSANLCDAIAQLMEVTDAERLSTGVSFAPIRPVDGRLPRATTFGPDIIPIIRGAAADLRDVSSYPDVDFVGRVVKLGSQDPASGGVITLRGFVEGRERSARLELEAANYAEAVSAHKNSKLVSVQGSLVRESSGWFVRKLRDFSVVNDADVS